MRNGLILMTALPVTLGHKYLIDFALNYLKLNGGGKLYLLVNTRSFEPVPGVVRVDAICTHFSSYIQQGLLVVSQCDDDSVPQNPSEHSDFWNYWKNLVRLYTGNKDCDYVFASEKYGVQLAQTLSCEFIPCNQYRQIVKTSGTKVRTEPLKYFDEILPELQKYFRRTITLFGPESCGKSTMTFNLAQHLNGHSVPEWAREYLKTVGPKITNHRMYTIVSGQYTSQKTVQQMQGKPFVFQDTDLLSTVGYYYLWKGSCPDRCIQLFEQSKSDLYIVMNDQIPFEPDALRYGGDQRETACSYWIELLEKHNCKYHVMQSTDRKEQLTEASRLCTQLFMDHANMHNFVRT